MQTAVNDGMPVTLASFIVAQSKHETGNYSHRFFKVGKNAFGYAYVKGAKWQLPKGGPNADNGIPIAQYASVENSVHELTDWIKRRQKSGKFPKDLTTISTPQQYATLLKNAGYYGDTLSNYTAGLINAFKRLPESITKFVKSSPLLSVIFLIGLLFLFYYLTNQK